MANVFGWGPVDTLGALTGPAMPEKRSVVRIPSSNERTYEKVEQPSKAPMYVTIAVLGLLAIILVLAGARHWVSGGVTPPKKRKD